MNRKQLVESVAKEFGVKPGRARKLVDHILSQVLESGLSGEGFQSPIFRLTSTDVDQKVIETPKGPKTLPARRVMKVIKSKDYVRQVKEAV